VRRSILLLTIAIATAACGGGGGDAEGADGEGTTAAQPAPATTPPADAVTVTVEAPTAQVEPTPTGNPKFKVVLSAQNHTPTAGTRWRYTVRATMNDGSRAGGTAKIRVFVGDEVVDTIGFFGFDGTLTRTHVWPRSLRGEEDVVLQAEVEGAGGTQRANCPVEVS